MPERESRGKRREVRRRLETVCRALRHWDPIGVISLLEEDGLPPSEYDSYAPQLLKLLINDGDVRDIELYLIGIRVDRMGLGTRRASEHESDIATKLVAWRAEGYVGEPDFRFLRYAF